MLPLEKRDLMGGHFCCILQAVCVLQPGGLAVYLMPCCSDGSSGSAVLICVNFSLGFARKRSAFEGE